MNAKTAALLRPKRWLLQSGNKKRQKDKDKDLTSLLAPKTMKGKGH